MIFPTSSTRSLVLRKLKHNRQLSKHPIRRERWRCNEQMKIGREKTARHRTANVKLENLPDENIFIQRDKQINTISTWSPVSGICCTLAFLVLWTECIPILQAARHTHTQLDSFSVSPSQITSHVDAAVLHSIIISTTHGFVPVQHWLRHEEYGAEDSHRRRNRLLMHYKLTICSFVRSFLPLRTHRHYATVRSFHCDSHTQK